MELFHRTTQSAGGLPCRDANPFPPHVRHLLIVTKGFRDLLKIGDQTRPKLFDLNIRRPETLFKDVLEIDERVTLHDSTEETASENDAQVDVEALGKGIGGQSIRVLQELST